MSHIRKIREEKCQRIWQKFYALLSVLILTIFTTPNALSVPLYQVLSFEKQRDNLFVAVAVKKQVDPKFKWQNVQIKTNQKLGTIIVDSNTKYLYYITGKNRAIRYRVAVGRDGLSWGGTVQVGRKAEWPSWSPPKVTIAREAREGRIIPAYMEGGIDNPLGARAIYLYRGGRDTIYRIHGTNEPETIGQASSSGCIRMHNQAVEHLYEHVKIGAKVIVIAPGQSNNKYYSKATLE